MTGEDKDIYVKIKTSLDDAGFGQFSKHAIKTRKEIEQINGAAKVLSKAMKMPFKDAQKEISTANKAMKQFKMEYLGVMFLGMAVQRALLGVMRASFQTWSSVTEGTSMAGGAMGQLNAAVEFFKFTLFDALQQSGLFNFIVETVLKLVEIWSNLPPWIQKATAVTIVLGIVLGTALMVIGQMVLGISSLAIATGGWAASMSSVTGSLTTLLGFLAGFLVFFANALSTLLAMVVSFIATPLGAAVVAVLVVLGLLMKKFGSFGDAIKSWVSGIALAIALIFQFVFDGIKTLLDGLLVIVSHVINTMRKAAEAMGLGKLAKGLAGAQRFVEMAVDYNIDIVGSTAELLDKIGMNPTPVDESTKAPAKMEIANVEAIGRAVADNLPQSKNASSQSSNLFSDEMSRQGYASYLG